MSISIEETQKILAEWDALSFPETDNDGWFSFNQATEQLKLNETEPGATTLKNTLLLVLKIETPGVRGEQPTTVRSTDDKTSYAELTIETVRDTLKDLDDGRGPLQPEQLEPIFTEPRLGLDSSRWRPNGRNK
jgi:hypothetical protein